MSISASKRIIMLSIFLVCLILEANEYYFKEQASPDEITELSHVRLKIPPNLMKAIEHNVTLTFCATTKLAKKIGPFFFPVNSKIECSTINRYAIGKNFIVRRESSNKSVTHSSLEAVFDSIIKLDKIDFKEISEGKFDDLYILLQWKLDRKKLPAPLLLTTFFSKEWHYNTGWKVIKKL